MSKRTKEPLDLFPCIPHQIEADWDEKWGPLLEEFQSSEARAKAHAGRDAQKSNRQRRDIQRV